MSKQLPLRSVARVLITKNGMVCIGYVSDHAGKLEYYTFPGGGNDGESSLEETVRRECLEEVAIKIKDIRLLGLEVPAEHPLGKNRDHIYRGTNTIYFKAEFDGYDTTFLGTEGDSLLFKWVKPEEAIRMINKGPDSPFNVVRVAALKILMNKKILPNQIMPIFALR